VRCCAVLARLGDSTPQRNGWQLGKIDVVSGGAITNNALFSLLRLNGADADIRVVDGDDLARSNLNRYPLAHVRQLGAPKVAGLTAFSTERFKIAGEYARLDSRTAAEVGPLAETVVVGVDHVPSRWTAQEHAPGWLAVGATSHFEVLVSEHEPGAPCAGCLHPRDDDDDRDIPTVSFVSALAGILLAHRIVAHSVGSTPSTPATLAAAFNLGGSRPIAGLAVAPRADCPIQCPASRAPAVRPPTP